KVLNRFSLEGIPSQIQVRWQVGPWPGVYGKPKPLQDKLPVIRPGQTWEMSLKLKRIHGSMNPNGFDYEAYAFANNVRAGAAVQGSPVLLEDRPFASFKIAIERGRDTVRSAMLRYLPNKRYASVMVALVMGDQNSISQEDWELFNQTGITHLVSISGSHITMLAMMASLLLIWLSKKFRVYGKLLSDQRPVQVLSALAGLLLAWFYCLLAGWGIPAQRTLLMLLIGFLALAFRIRVSVFAILLFCCFCVLLLDPWAILSSGFWLSFSAVAVLMWLGKSHIQKKGSWQGESPLAVIMTAARIQLFITLALAPFLILLFNRFSVVSPLVNAYAIPLIGWVITPLSLLLALWGVTGFFPSAIFWLSNFTHGILQWMLEFTRLLAQLPGGNLYIASPPLAGFLIALLGVIVLCQAKGWPYKKLAWCFVIPVFFVRAERPLPGYWTLVALDIGQGTAVLVLTENHTLLFDTGARKSHASEAGSRIILPYLRSIGVKRLDTLIVSHSDLDHAGGFSEIIAGIDTGMVYASFRVDGFVAYEEKQLGKEYTLHNPELAYLPCRQGQRFVYDGVVFEFLNQGISPLPLDSGNEHSCVLHITGKQHTALLSGDIYTTQEAGLLEQGLGKTNVVVVAHHGAKTSSGQPFVTALKADHAIAQNGYLNRYGHPAKEIQQRWQESGSVFWRTDRHGAITIHSSPYGLNANSERNSGKRYWHAR
ncbi:MAG: DNA internalization-related competence protein ComEC/Rec2, partial [Alcaligenaceae bacterium]|nr:DNA internalization-related competence protein ComEC/Rec2 [Alcaligenaceae bacterium]